MTDKQESVSLTALARGHLSKLLAGDTVPAHIAKLLPEFWLEATEPAPGFYGFTTLQGPGSAFRAPFGTDEEDELHWWLQGPAEATGDWCTWTDVAARLKALDAHLVPMELGTNARAVDPQLRTHSYRVPLDFTNWTSVTLHPRYTARTDVWLGRDLRGCGQLTVRATGGKVISDVRLTAPEMRALATGLLQLAEMYDHDSRRLS